MSKCITAEYRGTTEIPCVFSCFRVMKSTGVYKDTENLTVGRV